MSTAIAEFRIVCRCGDLLLGKTESLEQVQRHLLGSIQTEEPDHHPIIQVRMVRLTAWEPYAPAFGRTPSTWLYKRAKGDTIHGRPCSRAPEARHWIWADTETDEAVMRWVKVGIYRLCTRCKPLEGVS